MGVNYMAFRVIYKGLEVICETLEDVDALADSSSASGSNRSRREPKRQHRSIRRLVQELGEKQHLLLTLLVAEPDKPSPDNELRESLELGDNKALAGILSSISKRAKSAGLDTRNIMTKKATRNGSGERHYAYSIVPEAIAEVKAGLGIKD
jgi:hypothetical protein